MNRRRRVDRVIQVHPGYCLTIDRSEADAIDADLAAGDLMEMAALPPQIT